MKDHCGSDLSRLLVVALGACTSTSEQRRARFGRAPGDTDRLSLPRVKRPRRSRPRCSPALVTSPYPIRWRLNSKRCSTASAKGDGLTATVISPAGTWRGATGFAAGDRAMVPNDQMSIAHITKTVVAAQVMQLVEAGKLNLDDLAADRLPPGLDFELNGETIADLLGQRSGFRSDTIVDPDDADRITSDPSHAWTTDELLGTVGPERGPVGQAWEYRGINYVLLGLIVEHVTGRPLAKVLRSGVLEGAGYERLIYQPDERPTDPIAMPSGAAADTFVEVGGSLPSLAFATAYKAEGAMASTHRASPDGSEDSAPVRLSRPRRSTR